MIIGKIGMIVRLFYGRLFCLIRNGKMKMVVDDGVVGLVGILGLLMVIIASICLEVIIGYICRYMRIGCCHSIDICVALQL
jgi:hypothetical protein